MTIRLVIADDHPVVRAGLLGLLEPEADVDIVGTADSGSAAVELVARVQPQVVLMDLRMPGLDGVAATARITARHPAVRVLILTTYDTDANIVRAVEAGAAGYLLKDATPQELMTAVRAAAAGETVLPPVIAAKLANHLRAPVQQTLTPRELQVLRLVGQGLTNSAIARQLVIGETTVKTHLVRIFTKLDVDDRTAAVTVALRRDLLSGD
jgi:DNA-binding NarL/FixJ family response regulator